MNTTKSNNMLLSILKRALLAFFFLSLTILDLFDFNKEIVCYSGYYYNVDYQSNLVLELIFTLSNVFCIFGSAFAFKKFNPLKFGAIVGAVSKTVLVFTEFLLASGISNSLPSVLPKSPVPLLVEFVIVIFYFSVFFITIKKGNKKHQNSSNLGFEYKIILPIYFALTAYYWLSRVIINCNPSSLELRQDGYADLIFNSIFLAVNVICCILSLLKYRPLMFFRITALVGAISKFAHMLIEFHIAGGFYMSFPENTPVFTVPVMIWFLFLIGVYFWLFIKPPCILKEV